MTQVVPTGRRICIDPSKSNNFSFNIDFIMRCSIFGYQKTKEVLLWIGPRKKGDMISAACLLFVSCTILHL